MPRIERALRFFARAVSTIAAITIAAPATAQVGSLEVLHRFSAPYEAARGRLVEGPDGKFYGVFKRGGGYDAGAVFTLTRNLLGGFNLVILHSFNGSDGSGPNGLIRSSADVFYGTTSTGGAFGYGTVFRMTAAGNVTTLHDFQYFDGRNASGNLVLAPDGSLYGTATQGGSFDYGTLFVIDSAGAFRTLHSFNYYSVTGAFPDGNIVFDSLGNLYGTTTQGSGGATVFKVTPAGVVSNLHAFSDSGPSGLAFGSNGLMYGTAAYGGTNGVGTIYSLSTTGSFAVLRNFACGVDGCHPSTTLTLGTDGRLYGTTSTDGPGGGGTIFAITTTGVYSVINAFSQTVAAGLRPDTDVLQTANGNLIGMTHEGADSTRGAAFEFTSFGSLLSITDVPDTTGAAPRAGLARGNDGFYYGTTTIGGYGAGGTVFKIDAHGAVTTLHEFIGLDGMNPVGTLVLGSDGYFYGTTKNGGANWTGPFNSWGTVYRIDRAGHLTTLHNFDGLDGAAPDAGLVEGSDGNFYGTTSGPYNGTVFRIDRAGALTTLHYFTTALEGALPSPTALVRTSDGSLYGAMRFGGNTFNDGSIFKIASDGSFSVLHRFFRTTDGSFPTSLIQGRDGFFYGTTASAPHSAAGSIFKMDGNGVVTTLHELVGFDGEGPIGLVEGANGVFYGVAGLGGSAQGHVGTIFKITSTGSFTNLYNFDGFVGGRPSSPPIIGYDGRLYGTTAAPGGIVYAMAVEDTDSTTADLAVTATGSSSSVSQGFSLTYTVTVTNNGPATATNVAVSMPWAGGTSIVLANSPAGICIIPIFAGDVSCPAGTIPPGGHVAITIAVQPHVVGTLTAIFSVSGHESDPVAGNNTTTVDTEIEPSADMAIQVVSPADGTAVQVGAPTTFDVLVSNLGPSTAPVARVRLAIPTTLQNVLASASSASCDTSAGVALCDFDNFGAGGSAHVIFTATPNVLGPITLTFDASAPVDDPLPANNTARLGLSSGFNVVETIHVADAINNGVGISEVIHVIDGIQSASLSGSPRNPFDILDDEIIRVVDRIQSSAFPLTTDPSAIIDQETIHVADSWTLPTPPVNPAELRLTVSIPGAPLVIGSTVRYSVTMSNLGPNGATELRLRVALPAGLRYLSDTAKTCDWKDGMGTCDFGSVKPGWTTTMMIEARLLSGAAAAASFVLSSHESDPNPANNTARVIVDARPTVTINQAAGQTDPAINTPINFTVVFSEPVTGFTGADVSFAGSQGGSRGLVATVTGSEASYTVAVSGMTRAGQVEVSIPAGAAVDSGGNSSAASSSTDNSILYGVSTVSADVVPSNFGNATVNATSSNGQLSGSLSYRRSSGGRTFSFTSVRLTSLVIDDHVATLQGFAADGRFFATSIGDEPDTFRLSIEGVEQTTDGGILSGTTSVTPWTPDTRLKGWVDLHTHPMSNLAFAGKLFHGAPSANSLMPAIQMPTDLQCRHDDRAIDINEALSQDAPTRGAVRESACGDDNRANVIRLLEISQGANRAQVRSGGYPAFTDWPKWDDISHQKMWIDWVRRAWEGGQRVLVALSHHNHTLSELLGPGSSISGVKDDRASSDLQIAEITRMVDEHRDFMRIARSPEELHAIVADGRLAVVLGIEIDKIGNFNPNSTPTEDDIDEEIGRQYALGVRYMFPVHVIDNAFGDAALYNGLYNAVNKAESGHFFSVGCADPASEIGFRLTGILGPIELLMLPAGTFPLVPFCVDATRGILGHTNVRMPIGLTAQGQFAIRAMMRRGIIVDIDHMSDRAANQTLTMAAAIPGGGYPVNSGHSGVRDRSSENNAENARTKAQLARIACLGGMFGLGTDGIEAYKWAGFYESGYNAMLHAFAPNGTCPSGLPLGGGFMGLGTDANSLVKSPPPTFAPGVFRIRIPDIYNVDPHNAIYDGLPLNQPPGMVPLLRSTTGTKTWDYRFDGVAHYGMYVDFLRDVRTWNSGGAMSGRKIVDDQMMYGADYFYRMWVKADAQKARVP